MLELFVYHEPEVYDGCLYGSEERRNHQLKRDQAVSLLLCLMMSFLLFNERLRRLYRPLSQIVDLSLILKFMSPICYFIYFPYAENEGNCTEILISRIYHGTIMLGELHQIFFLVNILGLGRMKFRLLSFNLSLSNVLNMMTIVIVFTIIASIWIRKLLMIRGLWTCLLASLQIYFVRYSRKSIQDDHLVTGNHSAVRLFEKFSYCQLLPSLFSFVKRLLGLYGISLFGNLVSVPNVMDEISVLFFYLKILVIIESADVTVQIIQEDE